MELTSGAPMVIRPAGVGEVLDAGLRLARRNYWPLVLLSAWGIIPLYVFEAILSLAGGTRQQQITANILQNPSLILGYALLILASVIITSLTSLAVLLACGYLISGENAPGGLTAGPLYRLALGRLGAYVVLDIVFVLLAIPLTILFPLGIFLLVRWSVAIAALALEGTGPLASLRRSWQITRGSWWHTLGAILVWAILAVILYLLIGGIAGAVGTALTLSGNLVAGTIVTTIAGLLVTLLITPISLAIYAVLYYELRARREGFDLALRPQQTPYV